MKDYSSKLFSKAQDAIEAAEALLNINKAEFAAGRAYYAMFYVAEALLYNEFDLKFSQHGQVIAAYGKNFAKTKTLDPKFHAGYVTDSTKELQVIMVWIRESKMKLWQP